MFRNQSAPLATGLLALAFLAAGCGGDEDEPQDSAAAPPVESGTTGAAESSAGDGDFLAQANEICEANDEKQRAVILEAQGMNPIPDPIELNQDQLIPLIQDAMDELRALDSPELQPVLDDADAALSEAQENTQAYLDGDVFDDVNAQFTELGLTSCTQAER